MNRSHAAIVYMAGAGDPLTAAGEQALIGLIHAWQDKGAGLDVQPHSNFVKTACPGPAVTAWLQEKPKPWARPPKPPLREETPDWLLDWVSWRLLEGADPATRPPAAPERIPASAWEAASRIHRIGNLMGPQEPFLDWLEWQERGGKPADRPGSLPATIPASWRRARRRIEGLDGPPD